MAHHHQRIDALPPRSGIRGTDPPREELQWEYDRDSGSWYTSRPVTDGEDIFRAVRAAGGNLRIDANAEDGRFRVQAETVPVDDGHQVRLDGIAHDPSDLATDPNDPDSLLAAYDSEED